MSTQPEAVLENNLIKQLIGLGYESVKIQDADALVTNLKLKLEAFNNTSYSSKEFDYILNPLDTGNEFKECKKGWLEVLIGNRVINIHSIAYWTY